MIYTCTQSFLHGQCTILRRICLLHLSRERMFYFLLLHHLSLHHIRNIIAWKYSENSKFLGSRTDSRWLLWRTSICFDKRNPLPTGKWIWADKYFSLFGGLHVEQHILIIYGDLIKGSGLQEIQETIKVSILGTGAAITASQIFFTSNYLCYLC